MVKVLKIPDSKEVKFSNPTIEILRNSVGKRYIHFLKQFNHFNLNDFNFFCNFTILEPQVYLIVDKGQRVLLVFAATALSKVLLQCQVFEVIPIVLVVLLTFL